MRHPLPLRRLSGLIFVGALMGLMAVPIAGATRNIPPPRARTLEASGVNEGEAVLYGIVYPDGSYTRFWFQWGRTTRYGHATEVSEEGVGADFGPKQVEEALLRGLRPRTTYHFRIVARNKGGKAFGADRTFRTTRRLGRGGSG
jgi:hypothetical protein